MNENDFLTGSATHEAPKQPIGSAPGSGSPSSKKSKVGRNIVIAVSIVFLILFLIPVGLIGSFFVSCNIKMNDINSQTEAVSSRLNRMAKDSPAITVEATTNGDCLTGSGTYFSLKTTKAYSSFETAEVDLNNLLKSIDMPVSTQEIDYFTANDGNSSGGDTDMASLSYSRSLNDYDTLRYEYDLQSRLICENASGDTFCAGLPRQDVETPGYMKDKPVRSASVSGSIRYDIYKLD